MLVLLVVEEGEKEGRKGGRREGRKVKQISCLCSRDKCHSLIFTNNGLTHRLRFYITVHKLIEL